MSDSNITRFPTLSISEPDAFHAAVKKLRIIFAPASVILDDVRDSAREYREAFDTLDPLIQYYTSRVCPFCGTVCCANRHGLPAFEDLVGIMAMGFEIPEYRLDVNEKDMCQFMGSAGCVLPRQQRPFRCTWYFCDPLLVQIEIGPPDHYTRFVQGLERLGAARRKMLETFHPVWVKFSRQKKDKS